MKTTKKREPVWTTDNQYEHGLPQSIRLLRSGNYFGLVASTASVFGNPCMGWRELELAARAACRALNAAEKKRGKR